MSIDYVSRPWVLNSRQPAFFQDIGIDEKYKQVTLFLRAFLIRNSHRGNVSMPSQSVLFLRNVVRVYGTAVAAMNENDIVTNLEDTWYKALQLNDKPLALSRFAQRRCHLLRQEYTIPEGLADPCKHTEDAAHLESV